MAQVFISYSRKDLAFVEQLVSDLQKLGMEVWYDLTGLEGGSRWGIEIRNAIKKSNYVIVVLSPDSVESEWVEREYLFSNNLKKKTLPILYRACELPLGFLNVNYIDVQGENYSLNFDKIARFVNKQPLHSSSTNIPVKENKLTRVRTPWLIASLGAIAVLGVAAMFFLSNARENSVPTSVPAQTVLQPTPSSEMATNPVVETSTVVQPAATFTEQPQAPGPMVTAAPAQADPDSQAVFIQSVRSGNMEGNWTDIEHAVSSDLNVLVFAMPNWTPDEIYNNHLVAVWYRGTQWAILNQDMRSMPEDAAFNVRIVSPGENAFIHTATASNISENFTTIDDPLAFDPNALVFAMQNWSPAGVPANDNNHAIGVWYTGLQWAILNLDGARMREGTAFNVQILSPGMNAFVHTATSSNTSGNSTGIDDNPFAKDETKLVFAMPRGMPEDEGVVNNSRPIGVWYTKNRWTIYNQDKADMPEGAAFNILILDAR